MIDVTVLQKTLHKGCPTFGQEEEDLFIYKDFGDGTGILTDGLNCYFCYNDFKFVGDACPQDSRLVNEVETIILNEANNAITKTKAYKKNNPLATVDQIFEKFKTEISISKTIKIEKELAWVLL